MIHCSVRIFQIQVKVALYNAGEEVAYVVFDANGANSTNWFDCTRILYSSFNDLKSTSANICSFQR